MDLSNQLQELEKRVTALELALSSDGAPSPAGRDRKAQSVRELINELKPGTANDVALVIGYYQETIKGVGFFTNEDIKAGFSQAKMIAPKNISDVIAKNAKKGYVMPDDENSGRTKAWVLTNTGEDFIKDMMEAHD